MRKILTIILVSLSAIYLPGFIARSCNPTTEEEISQQIWETYCKERNIDPDNATQEQIEEYLDIFCETDEYCNLYETLNSSKS